MRKNEILNGLDLFSGIGGITKALGNAVVPQQAREAFERLMGLK